MKKTKRNTTKSKTKSGRSKARSIADAATKTMKSAAKTAVTAVGAVTSTGTRKGSLNRDKQPEDVGTATMMNRTGVQASPKDARSLVDDAKMFPPSIGADPSEARAERREYSMTSGPVGTMPPPGSLRGMSKTVMQALRGNKANVLLDKLGERLAFERTGTRLYEALLVKLDARGTFPGGPSKDALQRHLAEELEHFQMVKQVMEELGADPTAMTPSADVTAVATSGAAKVIQDPRTTLAEALHAIHIAELADNDGWIMLIDLCQELGLYDIADRLRTPLFQEEDHLHAVRRWLVAYQTDAAHGTREVEHRETMREISEGYEEDFERYDEREARAMR